MCYAKSVNFIEFLMDFGISDDILVAVLFIDKSYSDIYSFGHVLHQINSEILNIPVLYKMAEQCLDYCRLNRPTAEDLHKFLTNLFH